MFNWLENSVFWMNKNWRFREFRRFDTFWKNFDADRYLAAVDLFTMENGKTVVTGAFREWIEK